MYVSCVCVCGGAYNTHLVGSWVSWTQADLSVVVMCQMILAVPPIVEGESPLVGWTRSAPHMCDHHHAHC